MTNIDIQNRLHRAPPVSSHSKSEFPLWDQPGKINGMTNGASAMPPQAPTPNLWGSQYDPLVSHLNDEAILRQELLKHCNQLFPLANSPGLSSSLLNQLQAQQHAQQQAQQHAQAQQQAHAASPSPALNNYSNYNANHLASRLYQLRLSQQLENPAVSAAFNPPANESLANSYDRLLPQVPDLCSGKKMCYIFV